MRFTETFGGDKQGIKVIKGVLDESLSNNTFISPELLDKMEYKIAARIKLQRKEKRLHQSVNFDNSLN